MSPVHFALVIFQIRSWIFAWANLAHDLPICASCVAGMKGACHYAQLYWPKWGAGSVFLGRAQTMSLLCYWDIAETCRSVT
jgi:hypothetical protein